MMGGLAYMTGRPGDPLRAGASVNDIMGGMFGAMGAMAALAQREKTGRGQEVQSALFENNIFLVAQHMMQFAVTGKPAAPMPARISAWAIYDVFEVQGGEQIFLAVVSDGAWRLFCDAFGLGELRDDPRLGSNNDRVLARSWLMPLLREKMAPHSAAHIAEVFEKNGLPFAPIVRPQDLLQDPHLNATGALAPSPCPMAARPRPCCCPSRWTASAWTCACRPAPGRAQPGDPHRTGLQQRAGPGPGPGRGHRQPRQGLPLMPG